MDMKTRRNTKFNVFFNWNDRREDEGFCKIIGECYGLTVLDIHYYFYNPDDGNQNLHYFDDENRRHPYNHHGTETIYFGRATSYGDVNPPAPSKK